MENAPSLEALQARLAALEAELAAARQGPARPCSAESAKTAAYLQSVINATADYVAGFGADGRLAFANEAFLRLAEAQGRPARIGMHGAETLSLANSAIFDAHRERALAGEQSVVELETHFEHEPSPRDFRITFGPLTDDAGKVQGYVMLGTETAAHPLAMRQLEAAHAEQGTRLSGRPSDAQSQNLAARAEARRPRNHLQALPPSTPLGVLAVDGELRVTYLNTAFADWLGIAEPASAEGEWVVGLAGLKHTPVTEAGWLNALAGVCQAYDWVESGGNASDEGKFFQIRLQPIYEGRGVMGVAAYLRDLSNLLPEYTAQLESQRQAECLQRQEVALAEATRNRIAQPADLAPVIQNILKSAACALQGVNASFWTFEADGIRAKSLYDAARNVFSEGQYLPRLSNEPYFEAIERVEVLSAPNAVADPRTACLGAYFKQFGIGALLDVPVRRLGQAEGILCLEAVGAPRTWHPDEVQFATHMAEAIALAIETAERVEALQQLHLANQTAERERRFLDVIFENLPESIYIYDERGYLRRFNQAAFRSRDSMKLPLGVGMHVRDVVVPSESASEIMKIFWQTAAGAYSVRELYVRPKGPSRWIELQSCPMRDPGGNLGWVIQIVRDITERVITQQDLSAKNEELESQQEELVANLQQISEVNASLEQTKTELESALAQLREAQGQLVHAEKMAALGQLTAGIAHEINNPINFVHGGVEALARNLHLLLDTLDAYGALAPNLEPTVLRETIAAIALQKERASYSAMRSTLPLLVDQIRIGSTRTAEIVQGLRNFSRLDEAQRKMADIHECLDSTLLLLNSRLKAGIRLEKDFDLSLPPIECFPGQLNQVLMNIIANAIQAVEAANHPAGNGLVHIETRAQGENQVRISVSDNGLGIAPELRGRVFEPFFTTKEVGKGTGLGLSISYGIVQKHGGQLSFTENPGGGTVFSLLLHKSLPKIPM